MSGLFRLLSSASPTTAEETSLPRVDSVIPEDEIVMDVSGSHIPPAPTMSLPEIPEPCDAENVSSPISSLATLSKDEVIRLLIDERFKNALLEKKVDEVKFHLESREKNLITVVKVRFSFLSKTKSVQESHILKISLMNKMNESKISKQTVFCFLVLSITLQSLSHK